MKGIVTPPYLFSLNNAPFTSSPTFFNLENGYYDILIQDAEGCETTVPDIQISSPEELLLVVENTLFIELGDSVALNAIPNFDPAAILWTPSEYLSCDSC